VSGVRSQVFSDDGSGQTCARITSSIRLNQHFPVWVYLERRS
jgi:hypothetical protein